MKDLLAKYESKRPEIVFEWKDPFTTAEGWVVINSLRGGAAGGAWRARCRYCAAPQKLRGAWPQESEQGSWCVSV